MSGTTRTIEEALRGLEERLGASLNAKFNQLQQNTMPQQQLGMTPWRRDLIAAAQRLPDGDP